MNTDRAEIKPISIKKGLFITALFSFLLILTAKPSLAATKCETQYGGKEVCVTTGQVQVNKEVFDPQNNKFVDNLGINDHKFGPSELILFRITVKNVGDATLNKVTVTDSPQPGFLELATGSLTFEMKDLKPGEARSEELKLRVVEASRMPQNNVICVINGAEGLTDSNMRDRDTSQVCLERKVAVPAAPELPKTGPADWFLTLVGSAAGLVAGSRLKMLGRREYGNHSYYQMTEEMVSKKGRG